MRVFWYTDVMRLKRLSLSVLGALLLGLPATAGAYVSPENVLFSPDFTLPPSPRAAEERVAAERQATADRRSQLLNQLHGAAPESDTDGLPAGATGSPDFLDIQQILKLLSEEQGDDVTDKGAAGEEALAPLDGTTATDAERSTRDDRILERIARNREEQRAVLSQGDTIETLHGGAPLSRTGPGLVLLGTSMLAGALWTIARSGKATAHVERA